MGKITDSVRKLIIMKKSGAQWYLEIDAEKWKTFIFSDESRFQIYAKITRLVRWPRSKRYSRKYVVQTIKYEGSSIMVWAAIKGGGSRVIVRCPNRLNFIGYQDVLEVGLFKL